DESLGGLDDLVLIERDDDVAELISALGDPMRPAPRHQGIGMMMRYRMEAVGIGIIGPGLQAATHQDHVLEAFGGDEAEPASRPRQERVEHPGAGIKDDIHP